MLLLSSLVCLIFLLPTVCFSFVPCFQQIETRRATFYRQWSTAVEYPYLETVREGILEAGFEHVWNESAETLAESISIELVEAEACLAQAWKWKNWAVTTSKIARKYVKTVEPDQEALKTSLNWLKDGPLALNHELIRDAILKYPEAYLACPEQNYKKALEVAPLEYQDPSEFRDLLLKDPSVLLCTYNCADGGCNSECGNCWVSFKIRS
jgi:hypothetical protein